MANTSDTDADVLMFRRTTAADMLRRLRLDRSSLPHLYMISSQFALAAVQGLQFFLVARALGSHELGRIASVVAIASALIPFCGLGLGTVALMRLSRGEIPAAQALGNGLAVTSGTAVVGIAVSMLIAAGVLTDPEVLTLAFFFGVSEILLAKCVDLVMQVFLGLERKFVAVAFLHLLWLTRLACAVALYAGWAAPTAVSWAHLHFGATLFTAAVAMAVSTRALGRPRIHLTGAMKDTKKGVFFSIVLSAKSIYTDVDKTILARAASAADAGAYTAAFRFMLLSGIPITAMLLSLQSRIFRTGGERGIHGSFGALRQLMGAAVAYCLVVAVAIHAGANALPWLLGESYRSSADILRWFSLYPLLFALQIIGSDALSGADAQKRVSVLHALAAVIALVMNILLVPSLGWPGAVMAAYTSQGFLAVGLLVSIATLLPGQRKAQP